MQRPMICALGAVARYHRGGLLAKASSALLSSRAFSAGGPPAASYDAVIVGAGPMGAAIALELSRKGFTTLNVDKGGAAGFGSTAASCGIVRTMYSIVDSVKLAHEGFHLWKHWEDHIGGHDELGPVPFTEAIGVILKCDSSDAFVKKGVAAHDAANVPYEIMDNKGLLELFPYLDLTKFGPPVAHGSESFGTPRGTVDGAVVTPGTTGYISDPALAAHNLMRAAEANGGVFRFHTEVRAVLKAQGRVAGVRLSDGSEVSARVVVNASGPWSSELNRLTFADGAPTDDSNVKTRPMRVEVAYPPAPEVVSRHPNIWCGDFDTGVYFRTATGGRLCIGSVEPSCDPTDDLESTGDFVDTLSEPWERQVHRCALRVPALPLPNIAQGVSHMYDRSDDFCPIYDKTALAGYYVAIGTSGNQFKNVGVVGQLMAHLIEACEGGRDHDKDPVQFPLPFTKELLNMGSFSRLRGLVNDSTMSVIG